ncbi:MAG: hypothetical protein V3U72_02045 [Candidatus Aenigmarchaeota archaeon]
MPSGYSAIVFRVLETDEKTIAHLKIPVLGGYVIEKIYFPPQKFEIGQEVKLTSEEYQEALKLKEAYKLIE